MKKTIAIIGGTGKEGKGLAFRWALAGHEIIIGSRSCEKAVLAAEEVLSMLGGKGKVHGMENLEAAEHGEVIVMTVPFAAHVDTLNLIKEKVGGKLFIDVTVPIVPPKVTRVQMPSAGSAAMETKSILGEEALIASAFQNISYENLINPEYCDCDVLVCGVSKEVRAEALSLVKDTGLEGWDAGPLENSVVQEGFTSILIGINKLYGSQHAGIRITGVTR